MRNSDKVQNAVYPDFIPETRRPVSSPSSIVEDGKCSFGTFMDAIPSLNILDARSPVRKFFPRWLNSLRIKEWEAFEISFDEGFIVGAIYDVGLLTFNIMIFFDKVAGTTESNRYTGYRPRKVVRDSLVNTVAHYKQGVSEIRIDNQMQDGKCVVKASCPDRPSKGLVKMAVDVVMTSVAQPCVAVMPLGDNRPLYSQKELFKPEGTVTIGDRTFTMGDNSCAIIDDHKGYYPYRMHYDWITGLGKGKDGGYLGFNLTDNQVIDPINYNENYLWLNGDMHPLPPVKMQRLESGNWLARDEHDTVHVEFEIDAAFKLKVGVPFFGAKYLAPFGFHKGWIKDIHGEKHSVDGLFGMGEDKTYTM